MSDMRRWRGKVAIVTGASSGIGAAVAEALANSGMKVAGLSRRVKHVEAIAAELAQAGCEGELHAIGCDVRIEDEVRTAVRWASEHLGPVHVLINNAGVAPPTTLLNGDADKWRAILETNLLGLCYATREALDSMIANEVSGHIVHVNSVAGQSHLFFPSISVYGASKHGVTNLTEILRKELLHQQRSDIKVTSISPGLVDTPMLQSDELPADTRALLANAPLLKSADVADAILYVLGVPQRVHINELTITPTGML